MDTSKPAVVARIMIPLFKIHHPEGIGGKIEELFEAGVITEGEKSDKFEGLFSRFVENPNCSLVNSCTSALTLAYHVCGLKEGDEVITTPMTCMATNEPLYQAGAKIIWADVDPTTGNIDPADVLKKITPKTKAIVGVHWAGQPFDIDAISQIAIDYGIKVVEDAAHALGARYAKRPIGSHSDYVCFSFQAIKHLTTGDGGAICSRSFNDDQRIKKLRWFGLDRKYSGPRWEQDLYECGYKFHMNNINATIGIEQMKHIDVIIASHKGNGKFYDENINTPLIKKISRPQKCESSYWTYSLLVDHPEIFKNYMEENGVECGAVHIRNDRYSVFKSFKTFDLFGCDEFCDHMINIPVGWWLSNTDKRKIVNLVNSYKG